MAEYLAYQFFPALMHLHWPRKPSKAQEQEELENNEALRCLLTLLFCYPRRDQLLDDYPSVLDAVRRFDPEISTPQRTAVVLAEPIITNYIRRLSADERANILRQLREVTQGEIAEILRGTPRDDVATTTVMISCAWTAAITFVEKQQVQQSQFDSFRSEILAALEP